MKKSKIEINNKYTLNKLTKLYNSEQITLSEWSFWTYIIIKNYKLRTIKTDLI